MEKIRLPEYYKSIKFQTVYGTTHGGFLEPMEGVNASPIYVESKKGADNNKKQQFFKVKEVVFWEYIQFGTLIVVKVKHEN